MRRGVFGARWLLAAIMACAGGLASPLGRAADASPPVADFFKRPVMSHPVMSPNGRYLAATRSGSASGRQQLVLLDLADLSKSRVLVGSPDLDIDSVQWVNDDRLVFSVTDSQQPYGSQLGNGLFAVNREGTPVVRLLIKRRWNVVTQATNIVDHSLSVFHHLRSVLRDGSNDVLVEAVIRDSRNQLAAVSLLRLDTETGRTRALAAGVPEGARYWAVDDKGVPHAVVCVSGATSRLYWRKGEDGPWQMLREAPTYDVGVPHPLFIARDGSLFLIGRTRGADTASLLRADMGQDKFEPAPVVSLGGYDFSGSLVVRRADGSVLGVRYLTDARDTLWIDPALKKIQEQVDRLLPGTTNQIQCGGCDQPAFVLVSSSSDRQPAVYRLFDTKEGSLQMLAESRPWINPQAMAVRELQRFAARDGLSIPAYVTRPVGQKGAAPALVLVHGGPWLRGAEWAWSAQAQFLASRGYVVIEPEMRGSEGYGDAHFRAGFKQFGQAMQDDVADALRWAQGTQLANKQACIAGASYGGYSTLMGLINDPALYRCGVAWVALADLELFVGGSWWVRDDISDTGRRYTLPEMVGDATKDAAMIAAHSPVKQAARIKAPLLLAFGEEDQRVPLAHGERLRKAMKAAGNDPVWITYPGEAHGFAAIKNRVDFAQRVEAFLAKHLGVPPAAP